MNGCSTLLSLLFCITCMTPLPERGIKYGGEFLFNKFCAKFLCAICSVYDFLPLFGVFKDCSMPASALRSCGLPLAVAHFLADECKKHSQVGEKRMAATAPSASPPPKRRQVEGTVTGKPSPDVSIAPDFTKARQKRLGLPTARAQRSVQ